MTGAGRVAVLRADIHELTRWAIRVRLTACVNCLVAMHIHGLLKGGWPSTVARLIGVGVTLDVRRLGARARCHCSQEKLRSGACINQIASVAMVYRYLSARGK